VHDLAPHLLAFLFIAAFLAGFIDSIAGGGGMITIPAMLIAGIPPLETLGTNKLQSLFGSGSASIAYARRGHVNLVEQLPMAALAMIGGGLGAVLATIVPGDVLKTVLPFFLIAIALYFGLKPNISDVDQTRRMTPFLFGLIFVPLIGFYDGVFGPGTGSFFMLGFVTLAGFGVLKATAHTKFLNFGSNIGGFIVFGLYGVILWKVGLVMGVGQQNSTPGCPFDAGPERMLDELHLGHQIGNLDQLVLGIAPGEHDMSHIRLFVLQEPTTSLISI
jgi:uncharacterized membrane protein YfcA